MEQKKYRFLDEQGEHLHQLDGNPLYGTSTVVKVLSKPLTYWASGLAVKELSGIEDCKVLTKIKNGKASNAEIEGVSIVVEEWLKEHKDISTKDYIGLCQRAYSAHAQTLKDTAKDGTDMHAELEKYVKLMIADMGGVPQLMNGYDHEAVKIFAEWAVKNIARFVVSEMHCYSEVLWTGGIMDCLYQKKDGNYGIMDFKSAKDAYLSHFIQISGYHLQVEENGGYTTDGEKVFTLDKPITEYAVFPFGMVKPEPKFYYDMKTGQECFKACLTLVKAGVN